MNKTLEDIQDLEFKIRTDITQLATMLSSEVLEYAKNEKEFWAGEIGHIKRKLQLYVDTVPDFNTPAKIEQPIDDNEVAEDFATQVKREFDDLEYPKVNRVYKLNLEKESKFDVIVEPVPEPTKAIFTNLDDQNYTREDWHEILVTHVAEKYDLIFDEDIIAAAKAFMVGPVSVQRNKAICAETQSFVSLEEMKIFLLNVQCKTKDMVLYMTYKNDVVDYSKVDSTNKHSFEYINSLPKITRYFWRGVFLDRE